MFDSALGIVTAVAPFVLAVALIYAVLQIRYRSRIRDRWRDRATRQLYTDTRAHRDNMVEAAGRPSYPTPNDIT